MFLFDTCGLLWYTEDSKQLTPTAKQQCERVYEEGAFVSSISIWEIGLKIKKGKLDIGTNIEDFLRRVKLLNTIEIIPVDEKIWIESLRLTWNHSDPADRVIVATASIMNLPILTSDEKIRSFYGNIIW